MVGTKPRSRGAAVPAMHAPAHYRRRVCTMKKTPLEAHHKFLAVADHSSMQQACTGSCDDCTNLIFSEAQQRAGAQL